MSGVYQYAAGLGSDRPGSGASSLRPEGHQEGRADVQADASRDEQGDRVREQEVSREAGHDLEFPGHTRMLRSRRPLSDSMRRAVSWLGAKALVPAIRAEPR
jgi:hypothetical protein